MAERRMFAKSIVLSGRFRKLPALTQLLYYQLCMQADDDGFHDSAEFTIQGCGATQKDLELLKEQGFVHGFSNGIVVILHWRIHNQLRKDRCKPTMYTEERRNLIVGETGEYLLVDMVDMVDNLATQDRLGKDRIGKDRIGQDIPAATQAGNRSGGDDPPRLAEIMCYALDNQIQTDILAFYNHYCDLGWKEGGRPIWNWKKKLKDWEEQYAGTSADPMD